MTAIFCTSQTNYPKLTVISGDTVIIFTPQQVKKINIAYLELDRCTELNTSYSNEISLYKQTVQNLEAQKNNLITAIKLHEDVDREKNIQITALEEDIKIKNKQINTLKKSRIFLIIGGAIVGGIIVKQL